MADFEKPGFIILLVSQEEHIVRCYSDLQRNLKPEEKCRYSPLIAYCRHQRPNLQCVHKTGSVLCTVETGAFRDRGYPSPTLPPLFLVNIVYSKLRVMSQT